VNEPFSQFQFDKPSASPEIGWSFLGHLICAAYKPGISPESDTLNFNISHNIPIGLFRFIALLSGSQRTFSYSVQPSGSFNLQRRDRQAGWDLSTSSAS